MRPIIGVERTFYFSSFLRNLLFLLLLQFFHQWVSKTNCLFALKSHNKPNSSYKKYFTGRKQPNLIILA